MLALHLGKCCFNINTSEASKLPNHGTVDAVIMLAIPEHIWAILVLLAMIVVAALFKRLPKTENPFESKCSGRSGS